MALGNCLKTDFSLNNFVFQNNKIKKKTFYTNKYRKKKRESNN